MSDDYMRDEIEELKAQVSELTAERKAEDEKQAQADSSGVPTSESAAEVFESNALTEAEGTDLTSQFQELFEIVDEELKAANPVTVLVVFALGVLVGRLLPR